jgi:hypothetical protein
MHVDGKCKRSCMHAACTLLVVEHGIRGKRLRASVMAILALFSLLFFHAVIFSFYCTWSSYLSSHNCYQCNQLLFQNNSMFSLEEKTMHYLS